MSHANHVATAACGRMLPVKQAASNLGISASLLYQLVGRRAVPHYRIGGKILFDEQELVAYRQGCRVGPVTATATPAPRPPVTLKHVALGRSRRPATGRGAGNA